MELIQQLVSQLGVSEDQAKGGAGAIFALVKDKLGDGDFSQIAAAIPGAKDLLAAAPSGDGGGGLGGMLGGLAAAVGGEKLGGLGELASKLSSLGIDAGTIAKFAPAILEFAKEKGGDQIEALLKKVLN